MSIRILLTDEFPLTRQELHTLLVKEPDFLVAGEADPGEAVRLALAVAPEVVILDLGAAQGKGLDLVRQLLAAIPAAKVIALSMHADRRFVLEVLRAGALGYVLKESAFEELAPAIRAAQARKTYLSRSLLSLILQDSEDLNHQQAAEAEKPLPQAEAELKTENEDRTAESALARERLPEEISQHRLTEEMLRESEERYWRLLDLLPQAIVIYRAGEIVYSNPAGLRLFGAENPGELIGKSILEVVHPDSREIMQQRGSLVERGLENLPLQEQKFLRLNGEALEVEVVGVSITYLRQPAVQIMVKDISARLKAEDALRESEQRLANLMDFLPDATLAIDQEGKVIAWNKAMEALTGVKGKEILGRDNYEHALPFFGKRRPLLIDLVCQPPGESTDYPEVKREGQTLAAATYLPRFRGNEAYLYEKARVLRDSKGNMIGAIESIRDVTAYLKTEAERFRFSKLESLATLAGGLAQDFSDILAAIRENIGLAKSGGKMDSKARGRLAQAELDSQRAQALCRQLLTLAEKAAPEKKPVSLANLLQESARLTVAGSQCRREWSIPDDLWPVEADEEQINQAILNLLVNAHQAMPAGGVIKISAANILAEAEPDLPIPKGNYLKLSIADAGGGIPPEYLERIFDPYFSSPGTGSGLGLAVAYTIIKNHAGFIKVESQAGVGTTFHLYLPSLETATPAEELEISILETGEEGGGD